jgi:hypothetical protein
MERGSIRDSTALSSGEPDIDAWMKEHASELGAIAPHRFGVLLSVRRAEDAEKGCWQAVEEISMRFLLLMEQAKRMGRASGYASSQQVSRGRLLRPACVKDI